MRPTWFLLSILLHGTAVCAVLEFGAFAGAAPPPPARIEIRSTLDSAPAPRPRPTLPVVTEPVEPDPLLADIVLFDPVQPPDPEPPAAAPRPGDLPARAALERVRRTEPPPEREVATVPEQAIEPPPEAAEPAAAPAPPRAFVEAQRADNEPPRYPERERHLGHEGEVLLWLVIGEQGDVVDVSVRRGSRYPAFDREALRAARSWRFVPARENGVPVRTEMEYEVEFRLTGD